MNPLSHARVERRQPWVYAMMVAATANLLGNTVGLVADYAVVRYFLPQATWDWNTVYRSKLAWVAYWLPLLMACTVFLSLCFGEKRNPPKWSAFLIVGLEVAALGHYSLSSGISWSDLLGNLIVNPLVNHHGTYCLMPRLLLMDVFWISLVLFFPALLVEVRTALIRETGDYPDAQQMRVLGYGVRSILLGLLLCMAITAVLAKASLALLLGIAVAVFLGLGAILVMVLCQLWGIHASGRESLLITFLSGLGTAMAGAWIFLFLGENLALMISKACRGDLAAAVQVLSTQPDPVLLGLGLLIAVSLGTSVTLSSALVLRRRPERCVNLGAFVSSLWLAGLFVYWASFHR